MTRLNYRGEHTAQRMRRKLAHLLAENVRMRAALLQVMKNYGDDTAAYQIARRCLDLCRIMAREAGGSRRTPGTS